MILLKWIFHFKMPYGYRKKYGYSRSFWSKKKHYGYRKKGWVNKVKPQRQKVGSKLGKTLAYTGTSANYSNYKGSGIRPVAYAKQVYYEAVKNVAPIGNVTAYTFQFNFFSLFSQSFG